MSDTSFTRAPRRRYERGASATHVVVEQSCRDQLAAVVSRVTIAVACRGARRRLPTRREHASDSPKEVPARAQIEEPERQEGCILPKRYTPVHSRTWYFVVKTVSGHDPEVAGEPESSMAKSYASAPLRWSAFGKHTVC